MRPEQRLKSVATILLIFCVEVANAQSRDAIIFAPGAYLSLPNASFHAQGSSLLLEQLMKAGFTEGSVKYLVGPSATGEALRTAVKDAVLSLGTDDVLVVVANSYGFQVENEGYIAAHGTTLKADGTVGGDSVNLSELLKDMAVAEGTRQLLIVDGFGEFEDGQQEIANRFARTLPAPAAGQIVIANRGRKLATRENQELTVFMWSLLDGLDSHADTNRTGKISAQELTKYMSVFAEDARISAPRIAGKFAADTTFFEIDASEARFAVEFDQQARQLLDEAKHALYLELDAKAAINLLDRAKRLCRDSNLKSVLDDDFTTAKALFLGAGAVLKAKQNDGQEWTLVVNQPTPIFEPGSAKVVSANVDVGSVVRISKRNETWLQVNSAFQPRVVDGALRFDDLSIKPGFTLAKNFTTPSTRVVPSQYLKDQLDILQKQSVTAATTNKTVELPKQ